MRKFSYKGIALLPVLLSQFGGLLSIVIATIGSTFISYAWFAFYHDPNASGVTVTCFIVWFLFIGWGAGFVLLNMHPTIWMDDHGLTISVFFNGRVRIPWGEITSIRRKWLFFGDYLVQARHITPFHALIGWSYSGTLYPSFLISRGLEGCEELVSEIKKRVPSR